MTVREISAQLALTPLALPFPDREVLGVYAGDLLSWVMGRAEEGQAWVTVMTNANVIAVATLAGISAVIVTDGSEIGDDLIALATEKGINLLATARPTYETCLALGTQLSS